MRAVHQVTGKKVFINKEEREFKMVTCSVWYDRNKDMEYFSSVFSSRWEKKEGKDFMTF